MAKKLVPLAQEYNISIDTDVINPRYLPYLNTINRYEVLYGGSGSGKSAFFAQKFSLQMTMESGRNLVCLRKQEKDCKDSVFPEIVSAMRNLKLIDFWVVREHPSPRLTNRINGNEIIFSGLDDVENIKSIKFKNGNLTDIWYEEVSEEESVSSMRELDRRLRDKNHKCRIAISFNPVSRTHWLYDYIYKELKGTDCLVLKTTYKDNLFLPKEYIQVLERYQYTDPYSYMVYALGEWGTTGQTVFNANAINGRLVELAERDEKSPPTQVEFSYERDDNGLPNKDSFKIFNNPDGEITIFKFPDPKIPYVLAFDTAGEGSDYYAGHVMDNTAGEQVAVYHSLRNPDECILQLYGLGKMYNDALMCPEINFDSYPLKKLQELDYPNIYQRTNADDSYSSGYEQKLGFRTTAANRQRILSELVEWVNNNVRLINDKVTLNEMLTFTRQTRKMKGIFWAAENGAHDDLVMSFAIVLQAREQQSCEMQTERKQLKGFYFDEELDSLVKQGQLSKRLVNEYKKKDHVKAVTEQFGKPKIGRRRRYV